jgi:hypothetical protein
MSLETRSPATVVPDRSRAKCREYGTPKNSKAIERLQARTDELEAMAVWKEELQSKIQRALLIFEHVDCFHCDDSLTAEVEIFKEVCARLAGSRKEPLSERRAA